MIIIVILFEYKIIITRDRKIEICLFVNFGMYVFLFYYTHIPMGNDMRNIEKMYDSTFQPSVSVLNGIIQSCLKYVV